MVYNIRHENIVPWKFHPRNLEFEPQQNNTNHQIVETVTIKQVTHLQSPYVNHGINHEAYSLNMDENGETVIEIVSARGGLYALQTFSQLFFAHSEPSAGFYSQYAPLSILDCPDFEHRGLNLDISRNWIASRDVLRTIEAMAATKLNQLHLHAADTQTWPLEIPTLPELAMKGALDLDQTWSAAELEAVQRHGSATASRCSLKSIFPGTLEQLAMHTPALLSRPTKNRGPNSHWNHLRVSSASIPPT